MSTKSEIFLEASMYALNGLTGNPVNQGLSSAELVDKAFNLGSVFAARAEQILGVSNMTARIQQNFTLGALPADPVIAYTSNTGSKINEVNQSKQTSSSPTLVADPDGTPIAKRSQAQ